MKTKENQKNIQKPKKVLLAMSGGVDSSIAAYLLKKQGYEVIGVFMKNWSDTKNLQGECQWREERRMALKIAGILDIPLITVDSEKQYKSLVVNEMFKLYKKGITPNPDITCNEKIKFPILIKKAKQLKCNFIATGHYARIQKEKTNGKEKLWLLRGKSEEKDQSYFLYKLKEKDLKNLMFPIGTYNKIEIREIAKKLGFPNYDKKGTVGICFIGKINLKQFLQQKIKPKKGKILSPEGEAIGEHDGIFYYTIGQRLGDRFGLSLESIKGKFDDKRQIKRWYIARKIPKTNTIIAAPENHPLLFRKEIILKEPHFITEVPELLNNRKMSVLVRIRQVGELIPSILEKNNKTKNKYRITLSKAITGVSEGQALVLYEPKTSKVLGGGVISF